MNFKRGRYSILITPISYIIDLFILNMFVASIPLIDSKVKCAIYLSLLWVLISIFNKFYYVYRYTIDIKIVTLIFAQFMFFAITIFSFSGMFPELMIKPIDVLYFLLPSFVFITLNKFLTFFALRLFRFYFSGNYRKTIIIGNNQSTNELVGFFNNSKSAGYLLKQRFDKNSLREIDNIFTFIIENEIDEIYCSLEDIEDFELKLLIKFCEDNFKIIKFIPSRSKLFSKKLDYEVYNSLPILSLSNTLLKDKTYQFLKRLFDIIFSILVIILILSWLIPIIAIVIKLNSKGPVFFTQIRNGINYKEFNCFKFRSMVTNDNANVLQATRNDTRVTSVGKFIRKTSIDELPQFFNVLIGDMSVVGPRPHMTMENDKYFKTVDKFMIRHNIKPGITGLAQVSGFRGEVETTFDIVNRLKFDIYYMENWSLLLDIKIILKTVFNFIAGEDKAY